MKLTAAAVLLALGSSVASAQPGATPQQSGVGLQPAVAPQYAQAPLSEDKALWLSLGSTLASYAMFFGGGFMGGEVGSGISFAGGVGTIIAPSFGHWYADKYVTRGLGLRLLGIGSLTIAAVVEISCEGLFSWGDEDQPERDCSKSNAVAYGFLAVAGALWLGGTIDDIVQAPRRVRRINTHPATFQLTGLAPIVSPTMQGLALGATF